MKARIILHVKADDENLIRALVERTDPKIVNASLRVYLRGLEIEKLIYEVDDKG